MPLPIRDTSPCLNEERRDNQRSRVLQVAPQRCGQFIEFDLSYQPLVEDPTPRVLDEVKYQHPTPVSRGIHMDQRVHADIHQSRLSQHAWHLETDGPVNTVHLRVGAENLQETCLRGVRRIATLSRRIRLMQGNEPARADDPHHLCNDLPWFRHVDQNQARRREVECARGKTCGAGICVKHLDVRQVAGGYEPASPFHLLSTAFHTDDLACRTDALREKTETALGPAADLDNSPTVTNADLVEKPR